MGGSGIGGELLRAIYGHKIKIPIFVNKDYKLPTYVNRNSLVILVSYSGNTEETLTNYNWAHRSKSSIVIITSDGKLLRKQGKKNVIIIPSGLPPRAAIGYLFASLPFVLWRYRLIENPYRESTKLIDFLKSQRRTIVSKASRLAKWLYGQLPVIYSNSRAYDPVAYRWCCQFNENSKIFAHCHSIPEMDHNEIVGIGGSKKVADLTKIIFLVDPNAHIRNLKRVRITKDIIRSEVADIIRLSGKGKTSLQQVFYLIWLGDFVSYFLAMLGNVDPLPVKRIDELKARLK